MFVDSFTTQRCSCKSWFTSAATWNLGFIRGTFEERSRHCPTCPLFKLAQRTHRRGVRICLPFFRRATGYYVSLDILVGAGGTRLEHRMACRRVVPYNSFYPLILERFRMTVTAKHFNSIRQSLGNMLAEVELFPNDVDEDGKTLLHVSVTYEKFECREWARALCKLRTILH